MESDFKNETGFNRRHDESTTTRTKQNNNNTHILHKNFIKQIGIS